MLLKQKGTISFKASYGKKIAGQKEAEKIVVNSSFIKAELLKYIFNALLNDKDKAYKIKTNLRKMFDSLNKTNKGKMKRLLKQEIKNIKKINLKELEKHFDEKSENIDFFNNFIEKIPASLLENEDDTLENKKDTLESLTDARKLDFLTGIGKSSKKIRKDIEDGLTDSQIKEYVNKFDAEIKSFLNNLSKEQKRKNSGVGNVTLTINEKNTNFKERQLQAMGITTLIYQQANESLNFGTTQTPTDVIQLARQYMQTKKREIKKSDGQKSADEVIEEKLQLIQTYNSSIAGLDTVSRLQHIHKYVNTTYDTLLDLLEKTIKTGQAESVEEIKEVITSGKPLRQTISLDDLEEYILNDYKESKSELELEKIKIIDSLQEQINDKESELSETKIKAIQEPKKAEQYTKAIQELQEALNEIKDALKEQEDEFEKEFEKTINEVYEDDKEIQNIEKFLKSFNIKEFIDEVFAGEKEHEEIYVALQNLKIASLFSLRGDAKLPVWIKLENMLQDGSILTKKIRVVKNIKEKKYYLTTSPTLAPFITEKTKEEDFEILSKSELSLEKISIEDLETLEEVKNSLKNKKLEQKIKEKEKFYDKQVKELEKEILELRNTIETTKEKPEDKKYVKQTAYSKIQDLKEKIKELKQKDRGSLVREIRDEAGMPKYNYMTTNDILESMFKFNLKQIKEEKAKALKGEDKILTINTESLKSFKNMIPELDKWIDNNPKLNNYGRKIIELKESLENLPDRITEGAEIEEVYNILKKDKEKYLSRYYETLGFGDIVEDNENKVDFKGNSLYEKLENIEADAQEVIEVNKKNIENTKKELQKYLDDLMGLNLTVDSKGNPIFRLDKDNKKANIYDFKNILKIFGKEITIEGVGQNKKPSAESIDSIKQMLLDNKMIKKHLSSLENKHKIEFKLKVTKKRIENLKKAEEEDDEDEELPEEESSQTQEEGELETTYSLSVVVKVVEFLVSQQKPKKGKGALEDYRPYQRRQIFDAETSQERKKFASLSRTIGANIERVDDLIESLEVK